MTDKELRKLRRSDLLEMMIELENKNEILMSENLELREKLSEREIHIEEAGSIAEAALRLNGIFEAAQKAAAQYLENVERIGSGLAGKASGPQEGLKIRNGETEK